jgi:hypothetical protein
MASMELVGPTPENESEFSIEWVTPILKKQLEKEGEIDPERYHSYFTLALVGGKGGLQKA